MGSKKNETKGIEYKIFYTDNEMKVQLFLKKSMKDWVPETESGTAAAVVDESESGTAAAVAEKSEGEDGKDESKGEEYDEDESKGEEDDEDDPFDNDEGAKDDDPPPKMMTAYAKVRSSGTYMGMKGIFIDSDISPKRGG